MEVVLICGYPASSKTSKAKEFVDKGYIRLNRDSIGCKIEKLVPMLEEALQQNKSVVLDNTQTTSKVRKMFLKVAKKYGAKTIGYWMNTSFEDCKFNAAWRLLEMYGKFPEPVDLKRSKNPNTFQPSIIRFFEKSLEPMSLEEGFDKIHILDFKRNFNEEYKNKALILDIDGTIRRSVIGENRFGYPMNKSEIVILPRRKEKLKEYQEKGYLLLGASNQSGIAKESISRSDVEMLFEHTNKLLGLNVNVQFCPHSSYPIQCYCRKPGPGLGVYFIWKYKLNPAECVFVGDKDTDRQFAENCGFTYFDQEEFFK